MSDKNESIFLSDLDACLEIFDLIFQIYAHKPDANFRTVFFIFLLRHKVISKIQLYDLSVGVKPSSVEVIMSGYVKKGLVKRLPKGDYPALSLTTAGRRYAISVFSDTFAKCSASDERLKAPFATRYGYRSYSYEYIASVVDEFVSGVSKEIHHSTASKDMYIHLLRSKSPFTHQSECFFSAGELVTLEEKKKIRKFVTKAVLKADAVYSLSPLTQHQDHLVVEQDTGHQTLGVLKRKLEQYETGVFAYMLTFPKIVDYTLAFSISYPVTVQTQKRTPTDAKCIRKVKETATVIETVLGMEPHTLLLSDLSRYLEATHDSMFDSTRKFVDGVIGRAGGVSVHAYDIDKVLSGSDGERKTRDSSRRRANIYSMLSAADMSFLDRAYERGLSLLVLSNPLTKEIDAVKPFLSGMDERILYYFFRKALPFTYDTYRECEVELPDGGRRQVAFRNCYHVGGRDVCIENIDLDLGGRYRAGLALKGKIKGMSLICIASDYNRDDSLSFLEQYGHDRGSGVYYCFYDPDTFELEGIPYEI